MKLFLKAFNVVLIVIGLAIIGSFVYSKATGKTLFNTYIVQSGSMEPSIKTGSVVISLPSQTYSQGDIVTFKKDANSKTLVTHRIEYKLFPNGIHDNPIYMTSGDANDDFDKQTITNDQIVGKVAYTIPYLGYMANFAKTPKGFILFVIIPATIIIYEELKYLSGSAVTGLKKRLAKKQDTNNLGVHHKPKTNAGFAIFVPVLGAAIVFTGLTGSYFSNTETSVGNQFQAGEWGPQLANHIVINEVFYDVDEDHKGTGAQSNWEWVELFNPSSNTYDLNNWTIEDESASDTLPTLSVTPGSYVIISPSSKSELEGEGWSFPINTLFIDLTNATIGSGFDNGGDAVILRDNSASLIDQMGWGTHLTSFTPACVGNCPDVSSGHSLERDPDGIDTDTKDDFADRTTPSPGS